MALRLKKYTILMLLLSSFSLMPVMGLDADFPPDHSPAEPTQIMTQLFECTPDDAVIQLLKQNIDIAIEKNSGVAIRFKKFKDSADHLALLNDILGHNLQHGLSPIVSLNFDESKIGDAGTKALAVIPLTNLRHLTLWSNKITPDGAVALAASPFLTHLRYLILAHNRIGDAGVAALTANPHLKNLRYLNLAWNKISDVGAKSLIALTKLKTLLLEENKIGLDGAKAIGTLPHIEVLDLNNNIIDDLGMAALMPLINLRHLGLWGYNIRNTSIWGYNICGKGISDAGAGMLTVFRHLEILHLGSNDIGPDGATALAAIPLTHLHELNLMNNRISDDGATALAASPYLTHLRELILGRNNIGDEGAAALAASPYLMNLRKLSLDGNSISDTGAKTLVAFIHLEELFLDDNHISKVGGIALSALNNLKIIALSHIFEGYQEEVKKMYTEKNPHIRIYF